jgi:hypothetical protein
VVEYVIGYKTVANLELNSKHRTQHESTALKSRLLHFPRRRIFTMITQLRIRVILRRHLLRIRRQVVIACGNLLWRIVPGHLSMSIIDGHFVRLVVRSLFAGSLMSAVAEEEEDCDAECNDA